MQYIASFNIGDDYLSYITIVMFNDLDRVDIKLHHIYNQISKTFEVKHSEIKRLKLKKVENIKKRVPDSIYILQV
ncbi:hypothetical protein GLW05_21555 [Pontibacillus yanchengensis]|uniref:Uncharacterized protein n=1 Tax=Pontibacillus yanchengensis TaxID=462910 RepID=A0A6I5A7F8_9BACI|nr:hypothetical protein [Pontibacillus yanchengensis]MYL36148.1 hypothetical protein [Pontibacillus yanchengensis]